MQTALLVVTTVLSVAGAFAVFGRWVFGAVIREDVQPLRETMIRLEQTVSGLVSTLKEQREQEREGRDELHDAVEAIRGILSNHETRISVIESGEHPRLAENGKRQMVKTQSRRID